MGATQSTQHPYTLSTSKGTLKGLEWRDRSGRPVMYRYAKIPFAQPPVGPLRWRRPQPLPSSWTFDDDEKTGAAGDYTRFGPICPQPVYNVEGAVVDNPNAAPEVENVQSEDCLYLNIWVPAGSPPAGARGWPVQFFIHGGWLQVGEANQTNKCDPFDLLATSTKRIIVAPTYRLNLFGFAAGADLESLGEEAFAGNFGFWDQRLALEWTHSHISLFGGNPDMITVGGLSAGAHSAFLQLYHDTYLPADRRIIKQIHLYSNALAIQPNPTTSSLTTEQFDNLAAALNIDPSFSAGEKLTHLRAASWEDLRDAIPRLKYHTFRASTDGPIESGGFIPPTFLSSLHDGSFTARLAQTGARLLFGEVREEGNLYKLINPPHDHESLIVELCNYYPRHVVDAMLALPLYNVPGPNEPDIPVSRWQDIFAQITADGQVHASIRGLAKVLLEKTSSSNGLPSNRVFRYKINWRAKGLDNWINPEVGLCHGVDTPIWWASGYRADFTDEDKKKNEAFISMFGRYLEGQTEIGWGGSEKADELLLLDENGHIHKSWKDDDWDRGMTIWDAVWEAQKEQVQ